MQENVTGKANPAKIDQKKNDFLELKMRENVTGKANLAKIDQKK